MTGDLIRSKTAATDLSGISPEYIESDAKEATEMSMGTETSDVDAKHILELCDRIVEVADYRSVPHKQNESNDPNLKQLNSR